MKREKSGELVRLVPHDLTYMYRSGSRDTALMRRALAHPGELDRNAMHGFVDELDLLLLREHRMRVLVAYEQGGVKISLKFDVEKIVR